MDVMVETGKNETTGWASEEKRDARRPRNNGSAAVSISLRAAQGINQISTVCVRKSNSRSTGSLTARTA